MSQFLKKVLLNKADWIKQMIVSPGLPFPLQASLYLPSFPSLLIKWARDLAGSLIGCWLAWCQLYVLRKRAASVGKEKQKFTESQYPLAKQTQELTRDRNGFPN